MKTIAEFKECPDCKADARLMDSIAQEEIAKGNMSKDVSAFTEVKVICNIDPTKPHIAGGRFPGARVFRDICTKCGREFTTKIEKGFVVLPTRPNVPPSFV